VAGAELFRTDVVRRQLTEAQRSAFGLLKWIRIGYAVVLFWFVFAPLATCAAFGAWVGSDMDEGSGFGVALSSSPALVALLCGVVCFVWLAQRERRARTLAAAVPPLVAGAPAGCRVCGADLVATGGEAFARCRYCGADNLVDPRDLERARRTQEQHVDDFQRAVAARISGSATVGIAGAVGAIVASIAAPVVTLAIFVVALRHDASARRPADLSIAYPLVEVAGKKCLAVRMPGYPQDVLDTFLPKPNDTLPLTASHESVHADWLQGKRVARMRDGMERPGRVTAAYSTFDGNQIELRYDDGEVEQSILPGTGGLCVLP
jgi:hypothetical protein